jgi:chlorite dismutase
MQDVTFAGFWVYQLRPSWRLLDRSARQAGVRAVLDLLERSQVNGLAIRAGYRLTGLRPDADLMLWLVCPSLAPLQETMSMLRHSALGAHLATRDVLLGAGSASPYAPDHLPAFMEPRAPLAYAAVYPFTKAAEWYLLPLEERREMMAEHGRLGRGHAVQANTLRCFGLGDAEHVVALEADEPRALMSCMEQLRAARVRLYTRQDSPLYLGQRSALGDLLGDLA